MTSSATRRLALVIALAAALAGATNALAANTVSIDTEIKIRERAPAFHGKVTSDNDACAEQRRVKLFKERRNGDRRLLGFTRSAPDGKWTVVVDPLASGAYFAVVKKREEGTAGTTFVCERARSRTLVVD